ncbi:hypothetical protein [Kutzneria buriramensis]|uniref:Uncharacterized protein n=1 Tax=Kutzneria buriramensis TaxID=1045776 RepID=A0A3E0IBF4_9PSEU|nr:hypothetical protein [Kutzneria buriramensis]REH55921.1 hypothetical protein BCF44_101949 [Kutzneria buriramensis]
MKSKLLVALLGIGLLFAGAAPAQAAASPHSTTYTMYVTLYGALDNDPPGSAAIAYPQIHSQAGGTGTYSNPVTFATNKSELAPGTRVYYSYLKKYFIMEDDCAQCDSDWNSGKKRHIDLWAGNSTNSGILACEDKLTRSGSVIVNPASNLTVDTTPIFNTSTHKCYSP